MSFGRAGKFGSSSGGAAGVRRPSRIAGRGLEGSEVSGVPPGWPGGLGGLPGGLGKVRSPPRWTGRIGRPSSRAVKGQEDFSLGLEGWGSRSRGPEGSGFTPGEPEG